MGASLVTEEDKPASELTITELAKTILLCVDGEGRPEYPPIEWSHSLAKAVLTKQPKLLAVVEVLKFYAKPETYESETLDGIRITYTYPIEKDRGKKARKAIEDLEE